MEQKNGKPCPAMISEDGSVKIFDRQSPFQIAKQDIFGPDLPGNDG
jgi:hypothetical protein